MDRQKVSFLQATCSNDPKCRYLGGECVRNLHAINFLYYISYAEVNNSSLADSGKSIYCLNRWNGGCPFSCLFHRFYHASGWKVSETANQFMSDIKATVGFHLVKGMHPGPVT